MVAVRSSGLAYDCIVGYCPADSGEDAQIVPMVSEAYLRTLLAIANQRFKTNEERRERFRKALMKI